ncbi:hypothetical protein MMC20_007319 [Loxospora ochrophaea]|nr:hypothetical protein [Loxospora ochrophaea]
MAFLSFQARVGLPVTMFQLLQFILASPISHFERQTATIPSYVLEYAPLVWLDTQEQYQPSDIGAQLVNTRPEDNFTVVTSAPNPLTLDNLASLNALGGTDIYLTSIDDITTNPAWLNGVAPDSSGKTDGATSCTIIVNDHGSGLVDAFFMYFYAYNQGNTVLGQEIGDHVGDWEHNMIRFSNGVPQEVWYSQHEDGEAFTYDCLEKQGVRPITYSARGTHANYAINGTHDHTIPNVNLPDGPLEDFTSQGKLWDPTLSAYSYSYDVNSNTYTPYDSSYPVNWLSFTGEWGDEQYPLSDPRQKEILGISATAKYTGGPTGPEDKQLNRTEVCPNDGFACIVSPVLRP